MKLPIELVPNSTPPRFKWKRRIESFEGTKVIDCEGALPASVESCVAALVKLAEKQQSDITALENENTKLREMVKEEESEKVKYVPVSSSRKS